LLARPVSIQIWALRSRLEKQPTDLRRNRRDLGDGALAQAANFERNDILVLCAVPLTTSYVALEPRTLRSTIVTRFIAITDLSAGARPLLCYRPRRSLTVAF
jgi:hypothetical protein